MSYLFLLSFFSKSLTTSSNQETRDASLSFPFQILLTFSAFNIKDCVILMQFSVFLLLIHVPAFNLSTIHNISSPPLILFASRFVRSSFPSVTLIMNNSAVGSIFLTTVCTLPSVNRSDRKFPALCFWLQSIENCK